MCTMYVYVCVCNGNLHTFNRIMIQMKCWMRYLLNVFRAQSDHLCVADTKRTILFFLFIIRLNLKKKQTLRTHSISWSVDQFLRITVCMMKWLSSVSKLFIYLPILYFIQISEDVVLALHSKILPQLWVDDDYELKPHRNIFEMLKIFCFCLLAPQII